jgi:hypothetical protein
MFDDDNDEIILEEMREDKGKMSLKSILSKKKLSKWEMDEAMSGEI